MELLQLALFLQRGQGGMVLRLPSELAIRSESPNRPVATLGPAVTGQPESKSVTTAQREWR